MIDLIIATLVYVTNDPFFWPSMAFTTMMGIFIGAVIYNGDVTQVRKMILSLSSYAALIISVNLSRVIPDIAKVAQPFKPVAFLAATVMVTFFYLLGTGLGVHLVKRAHKRK